MLEKYSTFVIGAKLKKVSSVSQTLKVWEIFASTTNYSKIKWGAV